MAVWITAEDMGAFVMHPITDSALSTQLYIAVAALTTLCLAAMVSERRRAASELAESRARIGAAATTERRRLEGELHDSVQNRLTALQIRLRLIQERAPREIAAALERLIEETDVLCDELRRIAHGISPPLLAARGLVGALRSELTHSVIPVRISAGEIGRSDHVSEIAVYMSCLELVQNTVKHAGRGASVTIRLRSEAEQLAFTVHDSGCGFDPATTPQGAGLTSVHDRIDSVGGRVDIATAPGRGTTVAGVVPWPPRGPVAEPGELAPRLAVDLTSP
jgi:signal transduction histidine kinase